ncbi:MAG: serine--tRNA ligase, partial [Candidatus Paceibacterales bacterium]
MLDLKFIRENPDKVKAGLAAKRTDVDLDGLLRLDAHRRQFIFKMDELKAKKNAANDDIGRLIKNKQDPKATIASMKTIAVEIDALEPQVKALDEQIQNILLGIPNIPHDSVPKGGMEANQITASWG